MKNTPKILLLSSSRFLINNPKVFDKPFRDLKMAYVTTASKGVTNLSYIERERKFFKDEGYVYREFDIDGLTEDEVRKMLLGFDIVYVTGGNSFYLLKAIKESKFDFVIKELLEEGVIYMGASAGSYIACPTIEMAKWKHQDKYNHYKVEDLHAMNLVPFLVSVHYAPEFDEVLKKGIQNSNLPVKVLTDEQAVLIQGSDVKLIGKGNEIKL
ncbi:MAG: Type 1 glutamine amidotransferase-like domain-containing protein [Patescibacteria group bacterium]|nr:Type 1 glutamine amidotransferase-like domain-containing protein [Patescibacteria group bacterium]MDE2438709.1 Type 1 glutamine amidotransferase-like domain-containing protein [Patescibacteria group bacterium]